MKFTESHKEDPHYNEGSSWWAIGLGWIVIFIALGVVIWYV